MNTTRRFRSLIAASLAAGIMFGGTALAMAPVTAGASTAVPTVGDIGINPCVFSPEGCPSPPTPPPTIPPVIIDPGSVCIETPELCEPTDPGTPDTTDPGQPGNTTPPKNPGTTVVNPDVVVAQPSFTG